MSKIEIVGGELVYHTEHIARIWKESKEDEFSKTYEDILIYSSGNNIKIKYENDFYRTIDEHIEFYKDLVNALIEFKNGNCEGSF
ncbi:hypothetical protein [Methanobrevibacter sp.]|uniref:hypothetical protein n=1 Tax=Methanobrevibacter sp. TaxID=66852 RepID=UPI00389006DE